MLLLAAADGAGTASKAEAGARIACETFKAFISARPNAVEEGAASEWLAYFQNTVAEAAHGAAAEVHDYATTFLGAVIGDDTALFIQIGDGALVTDDADREDEYSCVFWPEETEYANVTYFATPSDAASHLQVRVVTRPVQEVALFTDGLQRLALHMASRAAHAPFFRSVFKPLRERGAGVSNEDFESLTAFLGSRAVLARTDDDKTLILATRRPNAAL